MKYIKISIVILLVSFISIFAYKLTTNKSNNKLSLTKEQMKEMLSYTIDGNKTSSMPTKGSGYKVKSITCKNGSILSWDNDNWLLEVEKLKSEDLCNIDFTTGTGSYTVTAVPSIAGSLDSTSKTTTENGQVTFFTNAIIDSVNGCTNEINDGKIIVKDVTSNTTCNVEITKNIYNMLLINNPIIKIRTDFNSAFSETNTETLYKAQEDNTDVYYFAGDARNNWVKFGTFNTDKTIYKGWGTYGNNYKSYQVYDSMSECTNASSFNSNCEALMLWKKGDPIYWRIIRTDKDGGVKLLYHGNSYESENTYIAGNESYSVNCTTNGINCIDYNNSNAKIKLDKWFNENLINYSKYINSETSYCNDKSIYNSDDTWTYFSGHYRTREIQNPTLNCNSKDVVKTNIALITADEVAFAGGGSKNDKVWYYLNSKGNPSINKFDSWWTMTGNAYNDTYSTMIDVKQAENGVEGGFSGHHVLYKGKSFRPVISLNGENLWKSGDGSASNPYEIVLN